MALVPTATYLAWYSRQSWCYRAFSYLWQNPLWSGRVPAGFSLCPMFWLALFSLFVFKPFVYTLLGFRGTIRLLHLGDLLDMTDRWVRRLFNESINRERGMPTTLATILLFMVTIILSGATCYYLELAAVGMRSALIIPILNFATLFGATIYDDAHKHDPRRCKVEYYSRAVALLSVIIACVLHPADAYAVAIQFPLDAVAWFFGNIWELGVIVVEALVMAVCAAAIWLKGAIVATFTWAAVTKLFGLSTLLLIPSVLFAGAIYGWAMMRWGDRLMTMIPDPKTPPPPTVPKVSLQDQIHSNNLTILNVLYCHAYKCGIYEDTNSWLALVQKSNAARQLASVGREIHEADVQPTLLADLIAEYRRAQAAAARRDALCHTFTDALAAFFEPLAKGLCFIGRLIAAGWKQVRILCSYLWALAKAKKMNACPYHTFTD